MSAGDTSTKGLIDLPYDRLRNLAQGLLEIPGTVLPSEQGIGHLQMAMKESLEIIAAELEHQGATLAFLRTELANLRAVIRST